MADDKPENGPEAYGPTSYWPRGAELDAKTRALIDEQYRHAPRVRYQPPSYWPQSEQAQANAREREALVRSLSREELWEIGRTVDGYYRPGFAPKKERNHPDSGWYALVPPDVAAKQIMWERRQLIVRARAAGLTYDEIAQRMGRSKERVRQMELSAKHQRSPVEHWLERGPGELRLAIRKVVERVFYK